MADVKKLSKCYLRQGIMLVAGMFFISLIIMRVWNLYEILNGLTGFYTAVSGFRMLLALGTMLVYYIIMGSETMMTFFLVFVAFYFVLLVHHAIYFAKVSGKS